MQVSLYDPKRHYPELARCWNHYGWIPCPAEALPRWGVVAETDDGRFIAYMGMYVDQGTVAFVDWAVRSPDVPKEEADEALKTLFTAAARHARFQACHYLYSFTKNRKWGAKMRDFGMALAEEGADSYIMALRPGGDPGFMKD